MPKNNDKGMTRSLEPFKKKASRHLLTPKSKFDFACVNNNVGRKKLRVKSITRSQCQ